MKIVTRSVRSSNSLINKAYSNQKTVNQLILLDFENSKGYMKSTNNVHLSFDVDVEDFDSNICTRLLTDASKFLSICNMYDELEVVLKDGKVVFKKGNNIFQLSSFEDTKIIPTELFSKEYDTVNEIIVTDELAKSLKKTGSYLHKDDSNYVHRHVFIEDSRIFAMDENFNVMVRTLEGYENCAIYRDVLDYITILNASQPQPTTSKEGDSEEEAEDIALRLKISDSNYILSNSFGVKIIFPHIKDIVCPPLFADNLVASYTHDSSFKVNKKSIIEFLASVKPFTSDLVNNSLYMSLKDNILTLSTNGKDKISVTFEVLENNGIPEDFTFIFEGNFFTKNIKNIDGDEITIEVSNKLVRNSRGAEQEAILCRMYSDEDTEIIIFKRFSIT